MAIFVLEWRFTGDREGRFETRPRHRAFLESLNRDGHLVAAGPWADDSGALILLRAEDRPALDRLIADDPYVTEATGGDLVIREWSPFLVGGSLSS